MPARLLEGHLQLPAHHVPTHYPLRIGVESVHSRAWGSNPPSGSRISTQRMGTAGKPVEYHTAVSEAISTVRSSLPYQLAISVGFQTVFGSSATTESWAAARPLARSPYLARASWRGRLVEGAIQPQACHKGDRIGELAASVEQFERCVGAISHRHDLALRIPAP